MEHQSVSEVIDVLTCAREVNELLVLCQLRVEVEFLLQEIFHSLHVMVGGRLYRLDPFGIFEGEIIEDLVKESLLLKDELDVFLALSGNLLLEESLEPLDLHEDSVLHQRVLGEVLSKIVGLPRISSIHWGYRGQLSHFGYLVVSLGSGKLECRGLCEQCPARLEQPHVGGGKWPGSVGGQQE